MWYDLHVHSTNSDGKYSKIDLLEISRKNDIQVIAFCDHNDCSNLNSKKIYEEYKEKYGKESKTLIIPAIEISAKSEKYRGIHILGYGIRDIDKMQKKIDEINKKNLSALHRQIKLINKEFNIPITIEMIEKIANKENLNSEDIEKTLMYIGIIKEKREMYKFTNKDSKSHVNKEKMSDKEAIEVIHKSGGIAVLAHPIELKKIKDNSELGSDLEYEEYIQYLKNVGIDGIETHTIKHSKEEQQIYFKIARKFNLLTTAGTDFHDETRTPQIGVDYNPNIFLKPLLNKIINKSKEKEGEER